MSLNTRFQAELSKLIDEACETLSSGVLAGHLTHEQYLRDTGRIAGMRQAAGYFDDVNKIISSQ